MDKYKTEVLGENPEYDMKWIHGFPDQMAILLYMGIVIQFLAEPWRFQMNDYFGITHSLVVWIHPNGPVTIGI